MTTFTYDAQNRLATEETGGVTTRYTYDSNGWLLEEKSDSCAATAAMGCRWFTYTYDAQGHKLTVKDQSIYSGRMWGCTNNTYDEAGNLIKSEFFSGCQGTTGDVTDYTYDAKGNLVSQVRTYGGKSRYGVTYQYDASGFLVVELRDSGYDGSTDETVTYTNDALGNHLVDAHVYATGSVVDNYRIVRSYDSHANLLTESTVYLTGVDAGKSLWCTSNTFDACGNILLAKHWSSGCDTPADSQTTSSYACFSGR